MPVVTWPRPLFQPGGLPADIVFQVFSAGLPADPPPISRERHGLPAGEAPEGIFFSEVPREDAEGFFQSFARAPLFGPAQAALGAELGEVLGAAVCYEVAGEAPEPEDLAYLQHAWGVVRWLCEQGAGPVYDFHARRWWRRAEILALPLERPFELDREVSIEAVETGDPALGRLLVTRGLAKFGRPDLVIVRASADDEARILALARAMALGLCLDEGELEGEDGSSLTISAYRLGGDLPDLDIINDALVVSRGEG
ncbi:MAG: hypothetical protein ABIO70_35500 [Pseudomonadota bacterium]